MGWASGSELAEDIWTLVRKYIPKRVRKRVARKLIDLFENRDCDTIDECEQLCQDAERRTWRDGEDEESLTPNEESDA
jgi:hypothetical protein